MNNLFYFDINFSGERHDNWMNRVIIALPAKKGCNTPRSLGLFYTLPASSQWEHDFEAVLLVVLLPAGEVFFGLKSVFVELGFGA